MVYLFLFHFCNFSFCQSGSILNCVLDRVSFCRSGCGTGAGLGVGVRADEFSWFFIFFLVLRCLFCCFSECVSVGVGAGVGVGVGVGVREFSRFLCVFGLLLQNFSFVHLIAISSVFLIVVCGV